VSAKTNDSDDNFEFKRDVVTGDPSFNFRQRWKHHSPTGMEFSYAGSGPADAALNMVLDLGYSRDEAFAAHQSVKMKFVACLPREGGRVSKAAVEEFVDARLAELDAMLPDLAADAKMVRGRP